MAQIEMRCERVQAPAVSCRGALVRLCTPKPALRGLLKLRGAPGRLELGSATVIW